jgi:hypothetical protein
MIFWPNNPELTIGVRSKQTICSDKSFDPSQILFKKPIKQAMKASITLRFATLLLAGSSLIYACNKSSSSSSTSTTSSNLSTQADDQTQVSNEVDNIGNDANTALSSQSSISGNAAGYSAHYGNTEVNGGTKADSSGIVVDSLICDASVVFDTTSNPRTVTINYNGSNCWGNRTRTGTVVLSIAAGVHWKDAGASVSIAVNNLKITRISDNKSIVLNGTKTITNVSGGVLANLANLQTITHTISADNLTVTFDNGAQRSWGIAKQRVFTYNNGIVITTTGTHTDASNNTGIAEWGLNRFGTSFESQITVAKVIRQDCDFRLVSGENTILRSDSLNSTITYGLDASGNATGCPGSGNYYLEVVWTAPNGRTYPIILPY